MANDLRSTVQVSTGTSVADVQKLVAELTKLTAQLRSQLDPALKGIDTGLATQSKSISQVLGLYRQAAALSKTWADASIRAAEAAKVQGDASRTLVSALDATSRALSSVKGVSEQSYAAKSRTIALDQQIAQTSKTAAEALVLQAQAQKTLAQAENARARTAAIGQPAPLTQYQSQILAAKQAAAAAREKAAADAASVAAAEAAAAAADAAAAAIARQAAADQAAALAAAELAAAQQREAVAAAAAAAGNARAARAAADLAAAQRLAANNTALVAAGGERALASTIAYNAALEKQTQGLHGSYFAMYQVAAAYGLLAAGAAKVVSAPISIAASFQQSFANVQRVTGATGLELDVLHDKLVNLTSTIPVSFAEISQIASLAAQLGISDNAIAGFTKTVAEFSAVTDVNAQQATLLFGQIDNLLGVTEDKYANLASSVAQLGASSAATESQILNVTAGIAAASHQAGFTTEDVLGLSTALASLKIAPELARGATTRIFAQITRDVDAGGKALAPYAALLNTTTENISRMERTNPAAFFNDLIRAMGQASDAGGSLTAITDALGIKNARDVQVIQRLAGNYQLLAQSNLDAYSAFQSSSYLARSTSIVFGTLSNSLIETKNQFAAFLAQVGGPALAPLKGILFLVDNVIHGLSLLPAAFTSPVVAVAGLVAAFATFKAATAIALAGTLAFKNVLGTAAIGAGVNLRTLRTAMSETFLGGGRDARAGAAAVAAAETEMTAEARVATAEFARQRTVMATVAETMIAGEASTQRYAAAEALAANGSRALAAQINSLTAAVAANGSVTSTAALKKQLYAAATELEAAATAAGATEITIATNISAAQLYRDAAAKIASAEAAATLTTANTAAATSFKFLGLSTGGWLLVAGAVVGIGVAIVSALNSHSKAAQEAKAAQQEYQKTLFDSVGGQAAFLDAVKKDTAAFHEAGDKATEANGVYTVYGRTVEDLGNKTAKVNDIFQSVNPGQGFDKAAASATAANDALDNTSVTVGNYSNAAEQSAAASNAAAEGTTNLSKAVGVTNAELERSTTAIGNNAKALIQKAIADKLYGQNNQTAILSPQDEANLRTAGITGKRILEAASSPDPGAVATLFKPYIDGLQKALAAMQEEKRQVDIAAVGAGQAGVDSSRAAQAQVDAIQRQIDAANRWINTLGGTAGATRDEITQAKEYAGALGDLSDVTDATNDTTDKSAQAAADAANEFRTYTGQIEAAKNAQDELKAATDAAAQSFSDQVGSAFGLQDAMTGVSDATTKLGQSLANNGNDFSSLTEAGQANLSALQADLSAFADLQAQQVKAGTESAAQGAANTAEFVHNLVNELASEGVDTSQLDFLVNYVDQLVGTPATWVINADTSTALQNVQNLADFFAQVQAEISLLDQAGARNTSDLEQNFQPFLQAHMPQAPSVATAQQQAIDLDLAGARANEQAKISQQAATAASKQGAAANKQAGQAAKDAGTAQKNAADDAAQALQKQQQFIKDTADYYAKLGSNALAGGTNQGKAIESLTKLGEAITINGKSFTTYSEGGRANLAALASALDDYGNILSNNIQNGSITVDQAGTMFKQYAGGVRSDLLSLGVPLSQIGAYFNELGASGSFATATAGVRQFSGVVKAGATDVTAMGDAAAKATDKAGLSAKELADYYQKVDDYFKGITDNAFKFLNAEGAVFRGIQDLGQSIVDNGKSFNTLTESGRKNFDALGTVVSAFETNLQQRIDGGIITAKQGAADLASFAGGIYNELLRLGVKAADIAPILRTLGLSTKGFNGASAAVRQYAGVLTSAAAAARAAAGATSDLGAALDAAADYADRLGTALNSSYDQLHGVADATDAVTSAEQALIDTRQQNIDSVKSLTAANADLRSGIATDTADIANFNRQIAIATRYGQKDKVADLTAKRNAAENDRAGKTDQLTTNIKQLNEIKAYGSALRGNTKEAIANRAGLLGLQKTMFAQIEAYAKTGASTSQVTTYTKNLAAQFEATAKQAGFSQKDIKTYTDNFATYAAKVNAVPKTVKTTVTVDTSQAQNALGSLPKNGVFKTVAIADTVKARQTLAALPTRASYTITASAPNAGPVTNILNHIPKRGDYLITPRVNAAAVHGTLARAGALGGGYSVAPSVSGANLAHMRAQVAAGLKYASVTVGNAVSGILSVIGIHASGAITGANMSIANTISAPTMKAGVLTTSSGQKLFNKGGYAGGLASGGLVPGIPPSNPNMDNLLVPGPRGSSVGLRSREYVIPEPAVDKYGLSFFNAIRNRTLPTSGPSQMTHFYGGGFASSGSATTTGGAPVVVQLSMADRKMLSAIANRPVVATIDGQRLDRVTANKQAAAARSGSN